MSRITSTPYESQYFFLSWAAPVFHLTNCTVITMRRPYFTSLAVLVVPRRNDYQRSRRGYFCFRCAHWSVPRQARARLMELLILPVGSCSQNCEQRQVASMSPNPHARF